MIEEPRPATRVSYRPAIDKNVLTTGVHGQSRKPGIRLLFA